MLNWIHRSISKKRSANAKLDPQEHLEERSANAKLDPQEHLKVLLSFDKSAYSRILLTVGVRVTFGDSLATFKYYAHLQITLFFGSRLLWEL